MFSTNLLTIAAFIVAVVAVPSVAIDVPNSALIIARYGTFTAESSYVVKFVFAIASIALS